MYFPEEQMLFFCSR